MRLKDDMKPAHDHLHSARKFTAFWGHPDDFKNAGRHVHHAAMFALKVHAQSMGCVLTDSCDLGAVLNSILKMDPGFLRARDLNGSIVRGIGDWASLDAYDDSPAPAKVDLLVAISTVEKLSALKAEAS
jgi:hypothetical protein